jgi:site-specific recombinase XerD
MSLLAPTLQGFFTERLVRQRQASPATVASYRDSLRLLLRFAADRTRKAPSNLSFDDLDAEAITAFLTHLETDRHNTARTRNNRLAAIRALFGYAALRHLEHAELIARVLAIPQKRHDKVIVTFLTHDAGGGGVERLRRTVGAARASRSAGGVHPVHATRHVGCGQGPALRPMP